MRRPLAIVFDLDGTLADTRLDIAAACNHMLASLGRPARTVDEIATFVGDGGRMLVARALGVAPEGREVSDAFSVFNAYYADHAADHSRWMPGAREALDACDALGVRIALSTNKPRTATLPLLAALGIAGRFGAIVAGGDGPLKPDPAAITGALEPLRVTPTAAWVVGDGPQDILAGRAAGAWTVAVLGGFGQEVALRGASPDRVLPSLEDFRALLDSTSLTLSDSDSDSGSPS